MFLSFLGASGHISLHRRFVVLNPYQEVDPETFSFKNCTGVWLSLGKERAVSSLPLLLHSALLYPSLT